MAINIRVSLLSPETDITNVLTVISTLGVYHYIIIYTIYRIHYEFNSVLFGTIFKKKGRKYTAALHVAFIESL